MHACSDRPNLEKYAALSLPPLAARSTHRERYTQFASGHGVRVFARQENPSELHVT